MPYAPAVAPDSDLAAVRGHLLGAAQYAMELRARPADQRGESYDTDLRSATEFINSFDPIERALAAGARAQREADEAEARTRGQARGRSGDAAGNEHRSAGHQFTEHQAFTEFAADRSARSFPALEVRNLLSSVGTDGGVFRPVGTPVLHTPSISGRRPFLRSLMSVQDTGLPTVPYIRETNPLAYEASASAVAEASAKPEVTMNWSQEDATIRKIAGWIRATDEIMVDAPTLRGYINTRLAYMIMIREEFELLNGPSATAPRLPGINMIPGTQTQVSPTGDYVAIIGRAIGRIENVDGEADGVVSNPLDYWQALTTRWSTQFDNGGGGSAPAQVGGISWDLPVVRTRAQTTGTSLVGAWALGSTLFDKEQTTIRQSDSHDTFFTNNLLAILAEERVGVAWHRPDWFVKATVPQGTV